MVIPEVKDNQLVLSPEKIVVLCEVPIYGTTQESYNKYWDLQAEKFIKECLAVAPDRKDIKQLRGTFLRNVMWKYNQIVGFIRISMSRNEINFEEFISFSKYRRDNKRTVSLIQFNGDHHFYIGHANSNKEISTMIREELEGYVKHKLKSHPNYYFDTTAFLNIIDYIDFISLIKRIEEENLHG